MTHPEQGASQTCRHTVVRQLARCNRLAVYVVKEGRCRLGCQSCYWYIWKFQHIETDVISCEL